MRTVWTVNRPNLSAKPAAVASAIASIVQGVELRTCFRIAWISKITRKSRNISTIPSHTKTRVPSGVAAKVCCSLGCGLQLPIPNTVKNRTNCRMAKKTFLIKTDSSERPQVRSFDLRACHPALRDPKSAALSGTAMGPGGTSPCSLSRFSVAAASISLFTSPPRSSISPLR